MIKRVRITVISALLIVLMASVFIVSDAIEGKEQADKKTVYEYALIGETYVMDGGFLGGTAPNGDEIPADAKEIYLNWAQGSYILEYKSKTVNLKVYEKAPADKTDISFSVPGSVSEGRTTVFPYMQVTSGIKRTDGAPEIGNYAVSAVFWFNGNRIKTVKNITDDFEFALTDSGIWVLSYEYTDIFGAVRSIDYNIMSTADRIIVPGLSDKYYVGGKISESQAYGYYDGKHYTSSIEITDPDGVTESVTSTYVFPKSGEYTMRVSSEIEGQTVSETYTVNVESGLQSFIGESTGFTDAVLADNHSNISNGVGTSQGILLDMTSSTASFTYNGIVNLNNIGWNKPIISFTPNHSYGGSISKITVTITDIYDSSNSVTVQYLRNSDVTATSMTNDNTLVRATFGSITTAVNNYYPLTTDSVGWDTSFHNYWRSPSHTHADKTYPAAASLQAMNFSFDMKSNTVYSYGRYQLIGWEGRTPPQGYPTGGNVTWYPIADLNDPSLAMQFKGFTTGEVYLTLNVESGRGDIMIHSIGGVSATGVEKGYSTTDGISLKGYDKTLPAAVGVPYTLPFEINGYISNLICKTYYGDTEVEMQGNTFTPDRTGTYRVVYEGINQFGRTVTKTLQIKSIEKPDITVSYDITDVKIGDVYTIGEPEITGYGKVGYDIFVNGVKMSAKDSIIVTSDLEVKIKAYDLLSEKEETFVLVADKDVVEFKVSFPRAALVNANFTFPKACIYDYLTEKELAYEIYIDGVKQGESIMLPSNAADINVEYRTERGSETFTLAVRDANVLSGADAFILPDGASASSNDAGTAVAVNRDNTTVKLPYLLSAVNMDFRFLILEEKLSYNAMSVRMTDKDGRSIKITINGLKNDSPALLVNGIDTSVKIIKTAQVYTSGEYAGKTYYAFQIEYSDYYRAILNASRVQAYVTTEENGVKFTGFNGGVYLDIIPEELDSDSESAEFVVTKVSNQFFYQSAFEYGDIMGPALSTTDFLLMNNYVSDGFVLKLSGLSAFDVLKSNSSVRVTLTLADGTVKYKDASPESLSDVILSGIGINTLKISANDGDGGITNITYRFIIEDQTAPTIEIQGEISESASRGNTVKLSSATAADRSATEIKIVVYAPNGKVYTLASGADSVPASDLLIEMKGTYIIRYIATDEMGNISSEVFRIKVEV